MFAGNLLLTMTFTACVVSAVGYLLGTAGHNGFASLGRRAYIAFTGLTTILTALFLYELLTHNFQIAYVNDYSSTDLSFFLLLSTLWAGQVGTFVLWLFLTAVTGLLIYKQRDTLNSTVMFYYLLGALFLLVLLTASSPFKLLPVIPDEGRGLNPLLQNFWMIIHPPIVFVAYVLLAVPFAFAMAALTKNDYENWNRRVLPWALFSSAILGLGIFLGGYWAYETLGWGGFWGWDPVENASLIPWLTNVALVHGLLVERKYGQLRKTNLILAASGFLLVIYGTFLTRSGVLADFSVHSFTDLGLNFYLVLFLLGVLLGIITLFALRFRQIKPEKKTDDPWSVDYLMAVGMIITTLFAILTLVGTSAPLITRLPFFDATANVDISYYYKIALPTGILMALLAGLTPFLATKKPTMSAVMRRSLPSTLVAALGAVVSLFLGVDTIRHLMVIFFAIYVIAANLQMFIMFPAKLGRKMGGHLSHVGFGILLIGFIGSSVFARNEKVVLKINEPSEALGYSVTYTGLEGSIDQFRNSVYVVIGKDGDTVTADPDLYYDAYNQGIMKNPWVQSHLLYDLYLAPEQIETRQPGTTLTLTKGETYEIDDLSITFEKFDMSLHGETGAVVVGAALNIEIPDDSFTIVPKLSVLSDGGRESTPIEIGSNDLIVSLEDVMPDRKMIELRIVGQDETETNILVLDVGTKPLIMFVWLGSIIIVVGALIATYHRYRLSTYV